MAKREQTQEVPVRMEYPRTQQDGEACTTHSAEAHSAAYDLLHRGFHSFSGAEWPGRLGGIHRSNSAGVALRGKPDQAQAISDKGAASNQPNQREKVDLDLHRSEAAELSRCGTPEQGMQADGGLLSSMAHNYAVPHPDSSTIGMSPRRSKPPMQSAESSHSEDRSRLSCHPKPESTGHGTSNANPGDFQGRESPPWSPRRVPPAHLWGEGPPRHPGYRSGGAILHGASEGAGAADLAKAAFELQGLLSSRASLGLGPLLHAQPYFSATGATGAQRHAGQCAPFSGPSTPVLQAVPIQEPPAQCSHAQIVSPPGTLCAEDAVLSPVPMQLPAGGSFPTPCMWELAAVHLAEPLLPAAADPRAEEVESSHGAFFSHETGVHAAISTTTADAMGISPILQCKSSLQPKQAHGPEGGPSTPANAEKDKTDGSKRRAEDAATSEQPAGASRKPKRATKRRLF